MSLVTGLVQNFVRDSGVVHEARLGQRDAMWPVCSGHAFAGECIPHLLIEKPRRIAAAHHGIAQMEMIAMRRRKTLDGRLSRTGASHRAIRNAGERLQQRQGAQLQRIELQRILLGRHSVPVRSGGRGILIGHGIFRQETVGNRAGMGE